MAVGHCTVDPKRRVSPRWVVSSQPPPGSRSACDPVGELDVLQGPESLGIRIEIGLDLGVVRKIRILIGIKIPERKPVFGGVDMQ